MGTQQSRDSGSGEAARATVDVRTLVLVMVGAAALLAAYFIGSTHDGGPSSSAAATTTAAGDDSANASSDEETMVMTGTGKVTPVPDEMTFHIGIKGNASDVSAALAAANGKAKSVLHRLRGEGVNPLDVKTTGLSIHPVYDYSGGRAVITGYEASESMTVEVKELASAGRVLGAAADAGGNAIRISGIKLGVADQDALLKQAREDAVAEATTKAKEYAAATGQELGQVISLREVNPAGSIPVGKMAFDSASSLSGPRSSGYVPIRTGRSSLEVTVAVVWSFA
jgi:uncharacterized protein